MPDIDEYSGVEMANIEEISGVDAKRRRGLLIHLQVQGLTLRKAV